MRIEKWEFAWEFSQLSCPGQTRTRVAWELRSESFHKSFLNSHVLVKREQELRESWWELRSESFHESFLNSHVPVKREQELRESWWELRSESFHESFLNSHFPVKREQELHQSWWELRSESLHDSFLNSHMSPSQTRTRVAWELRSESLHLMPRSNENKSCMRVDDYRVCSENSHQLSSKSEPAKSWWELMRVVRNVWANWFNVKHWVSSLKHFLQILQNVEFTDASYVTVAMLDDIDKGLCLFAMQISPTWRKSLCPLNPMGVVAHHLYCDHRNFDSVNQGPVVQRWISANPAWVKI
jgi:hypothetical protein